MRRAFASIVVGFIVLTGIDAAFGGQEGAASAEIEKLKARIERLEHLLDTQQRTIEGQRKIIEQQSAELKEIKAVASKIEGASPLLRKLSEKVSLSGLVEVEAFARDGYEGEDESDITLATVEVGLDAEICEWVSAHILLLWEEDDTEPLDVDEATVTIGDTERFPLYVSAGKMYVPFGSFESNMIQDPLTLELGETRESAVQLGLEFKGFHSSVYAFNGDIDETGNDEEVNSFGASAGYAFETNTMALDLGVGWISNIADSDGLTDALPAEIQDHVEGLTAHALFNYGPFGLMVEYVSALDEFKRGELAFDGSGARPASWNVEAAYTNEILGKETTFALGYQGTDEAVALDLPKHRYLATIGMQILKNTTLALEYLHDEDYPQRDGGTGDEADQVTVQVAIEF